MVKIHHIKKHCLYPKMICINIFKEIKNGLLNNKIEPQFPDWHYIAYNYHHQNQNVVP